MDLIIAFGIFIVFMVLSLIMGISMVPALLLGLAAFLTVGKRKGFTLLSMLNMSIKSIKDSVVVIEVMLIIGLVTAVWRVSGTITAVSYTHLDVYKRQVDGNYSYGNMQTENVNGFSWSTNSTTSFGQMMYQTCLLYTS